MTIARFGTWSVKSKFALCSGALILVFSIAFTVWTLQGVKKDLRNSVIDSQETMVRSVANDIDQKVELRRDAIVTIAALLSQAAPTPGSEMEAFFKPRPVLQKMFDIVLVVDASGRVVHTVPRQPIGDPANHQVAAGDYFEQVLRGRPIVVSALQRESKDGKPYIAFAAPLHSAVGRFSGALVCLTYVDNANFFGKLGDAHIGREGYFALVATGERPIYLMHGHKDQVAMPAPDGRVDPAMFGNGGAAEDADASGNLSLRTHVLLRAVPWELIAVYPSDEAFAGLQMRQREVLLAGLAMSALASLIAWFLASWLLQPLARLRRVMENAGPGVAVHAATFGSAELAALVRAYNAQVGRQREFENQLKASERRMRAITDNIPAEVAHVDAREIYTFCNARHARGFENGAQDMIGRTILEVRGEQDRASLAPHIASALRGETVSFEFSKMDQGETLHSRAIFVPDLDDSGLACGFYAMTFDVTELKEAQHHLARLARCDTLTGLPNRYQFNETLPLALARCARSGTSLALMYLDIDHFKQINDTFGHGTGDQVLKEFAQRLKHTVRTTDLVARLAGDEFVVILEELETESEPQMVAEKILAAMKSPLAIDGRMLQITTSIGIAFHASGSIGVSDLLAQADAALYRAKAAGRNTYQTVGAGAG